MMKIRHIVLAAVVFAMLLCLAACAGPAKNDGWTSNGDGTHSRPSASDTSVTETEPCEAEDGKSVCKICGGEITEHKHDYKEVVDEAFLKFAANCKSPAIYNKSCSCGKVSKQVFESGEPTEHNFTKKTNSPKNLCRQGNCSTPSLYYYSCKECGETGTETYEVPITAGYHDFGEWTYNGDGTHTRTSSIGQEVCRDTNSHLNLGIGRYTAALTWCAKISGCDVDKIDYVPNGKGITDEMVEIAKEAVKNAIATPLSVTQSTHTAPVDDSDAALAKSAGFDLKDYVLYTWHANDNSYWNSTASAKMTTETSPSAGNYGRFLCSDKLSVETLPADTVFILDQGYALRIEKFSSDSAPYSGTRPGSSTQAVQSLTSAFLSDATFVTFNLSKSNSTKIEDFAEAATHLRVYVKK